MAESRGLALRWDPDRRALATLGDGVTFVARVEPYSTLDPLSDLTVDAEADDRAPAETDGGTERVSIVRAEGPSGADSEERP